jgi:hypothetical protein
MPELFYALILIGTFLLIALTLRLLGKRGR